MKNQTNNSLSLGEGNTPLIRLANLKKAFDWKGELWAKIEYQNPTGSFKDRGSIVEIAEAKRQRKRGVVCASTGNMAASLAAYAARAKLPCFVVVPESTPPAKLKQATVCGARLENVNGNYDDCIATAQKLAKKNNFLLCGDYEIRRAGQRSIGKELAQSGVAFDAFICPIGNGTLGCAIAEGLAFSNKYPQFIGVQGFGADPLAIAWGSNRPIIPMVQPKTIASAMCVGNPLDGSLTLQWIRKTDGAIYSVDDKEIAQAQQIIARIEGIYVEKAASATVACILKLNQNVSTIILILTGSGLKEVSL